MTEVTKRVRAWLNEIVIGLNLCPFAGPLKPDAIYIAESSSVTMEDILTESLQEALALIEADEEDRDTSLLVFEKGLSDFEEYLDALAALEELLEESGAHQWVQIASFHPQYLFDGEDPEDVSHFTNRSPYALFHFLRVSHVEEAIEKHPDTLNIPKANAERLRALGHDQVAKIWRNILDL